MPEYDETAQLLMRAFPGWHCWYGQITGAWWAAPPRGHPPRSLIEAPTAPELAVLIRQLRDL